MAKNVMANCELLSTVKNTDHRWSSSDEQWIAPFVSLSGGFAMTIFNFPLLTTMSEEEKNQ